MKRASEHSLWELMSVNQFKTLADQHQLSYSDTDNILSSLSTVYDANTLSTRLDALITLTNSLKKFTGNPAIEELHDQCRDIMRLIFRGPTDAELQLLHTDQKQHTLDKPLLRQLIDQELQKKIEHRDKRLPFKPDFVHDAPTKAPLRQLLEDLVDWNNEQDPEIKREKLEKVMRSSTVKTTKIFKPKIISEQLTRERRMFIIFSVAHLLKHLLVKGTTKLATEAYQETDLIRQVKIYRGKELEGKRLLPMAEHFYQLTLQGNDDDRCFKVYPFSTEKMSAHGTHVGEAIFVATTSGDFFADSTVDSKEPGKSVFHSSLDRHPFFAGRLATDAKGKVIGYDNHTGHFLHNEDNLLNMTQHFCEIGLLSEDILATLVMQRNIPSDTEQLVSYIRKLPGHTEQKSLTDPAPLNARFIDNLKSDPVNLNSYFATKKGGPIKRKEEPLPAKDNRNSGIRNDFENIGVNPVSMLCQQELEEAREKICLKSRLNPKKLQFDFVKDFPKDGQLKTNMIYFCPDINSKGFCNFRLRLNKKLIYTGKIAYSKVHKAKTDVLAKLRGALLFTDQRPIFTPDESLLLIQAAINLPTYEQCLMRPFYFLFRHRFPKNSPNRVNHAADQETIKQPADILSEISMNISRDAYNAFLDELSHHDKTHHLLDPRLQSNNLFYGKMCLFRTNKSTDNTKFDPDKKGRDYYRVLQPLHEINHFKRKEKPKPVPQKRPATQRADVEIVDDDEFEGTLSLVRQTTLVVK
ncbi:MAG: hypothetical protein K2X50_01610 [Gammaproteobacteria bacterium]|nr:hypothetical protein [Gammaproteobacteria bacterium]